MASKLNSNLTALVPITIPNGTTTAAAAVDLTNKIIVGVIFPAAFTGATITFSTSWDNSTFYTANTGAADITVAKQLGKLVAVKDTSYQYLDFLGRYVNIVSASSEGGDRIVQLVTRARV